MKKLSLETIEAYDAYKGFTGILGKASIGMSWAIDDIKAILEKHAKRYDEEKDKLLARFGEKLDSVNNGQLRYSIKTENLKAMNEAMDALNKIKIAIEFEPLSYEAIEAEGGNIVFDVTTAKVLRPFIEKMPKKEVNKGEIPAPVERAKRKPLPPIKDSSVGEGS